MKSKWHRYNMNLSSFNEVASIDGARAMLYDDFMYLFDPSDEDIYEFVEGPTYSFRSHWFPINPLIGTVCQTNHNQIVVVFRKALNRELF